jgi:hypothetical protein
VSDISGDDALDPTRFEFEPVHKRWTEYFPSFGAQAFLRMK